MCCCLLYLNLRLLKYIKFIKLIDHGERIKDAGLTGCITDHAKGLRVGKGVEKPNAIPIG